MSKIHYSPKIVAMDARNKIRQQIRVSQAKQNVRQHDLAVKLDLSDAAVSIMMKDLDKITIKRAREINWILHLDPVTVLLWLGFSEADIKTINKENSA